MKFRFLIALGLLLVAAAPAQAAAPRMTGVVLAAHPARGTFVLAGARGSVLTIHARTHGLHVGSAMSLVGHKLVDGTFTASGVQIRHTDAAHARILGTVVRTAKSSFLVSAGRSVLRVHRSAARRLSSRADDGDVRVGERARFELRFDDDDLVEVGVPTPVAQAGTATIEGRIVSLSPLVIATGGLPLTITVPAGLTLPANLVVGGEVEATVSLGAANSLTLVSVENDQAEAQDEVEVRGTVTQSSATSITVASRGISQTFQAPSGTTLPVVQLGTSVEARGVVRNGVLTLTRLKTEDRGDDHGNGEDGDGGHH